MISLIFQILVLAFVIAWAIWCYRETKKQDKRMDLLSLENAKLIEENEHLKSRLHNLGFTEIDLNK